MVSLYTHKYSWVNWILALCVMAIISCASAVTYGRLRTMTDTTLTELSSCGTLPCFRGIAPGFTRWTDAQGFFSTVPSSQQTKWNITFTTSESNVIIYRSLDGQSVGTITMVIAPSRMLRIGDIGQQYRNPCRLDFLLYPENEVVMHYPNLVVISPIVDGRVGLEAPVSYITLTDTLYPCNSPEAPCTQTAPEVRNQFTDCLWKGFASLLHYFSP